MSAAEDAPESMPSSEQQEATLKKKYGGIVPKKPPLISKDHERAYFDSADWALGKQGVEKPKGPLEGLRPKLQDIGKGVERVLSFQILRNSYALDLQQEPTHQETRYRKSPYAPSEGEDGENAPSEETTTGQ